MPNFKQPPIRFCTHSWIPWRGNWEFATCQYCRHDAFWSYILGKYVRTIPSTHTEHYRRWELRKPKSWRPEL